MIRKIVAAFLFMTAIAVASMGRIKGFRYSEQGGPAAGIGHMMFLLFYLPTALTLVAAGFIIWKPRFTKSNQTYKRILRICAVLIVLAASAFMINNGIHTLDNYENATLAGVLASNFLLSLPLLLLAILLVVAARDSDESE